MSDLQCATSVIVLPGGLRVDLETLRSERPAVLLSGIDGHVELAEALDLPVRRLADDGDRADVRDPALDERGGAPGLAGGLARLLAEVADEYRGECVVVVVPEEVVADLRAQVLPAGSMAPGARVQVDDDGHRWAPWPSAAPE